MGKKREELRLSKVTFIVKDFSASERAKWNKMWDIILRKSPEHLQEDQGKINGNATK